MQWLIDLRKRDLLVGADGFNSDLIQEDRDAGMDGEEQIIPLRWSFCCLCKLWIFFSCFDAQISFDFARARRDAVQFMEIRIQDYFNGLQFFF